MVIEYGIWVMAWVTNLGKRLNLQQCWLKNKQRRLNLRKILFKNNRGLGNYDQISSSIGRVTALLSLRGGLC